MALLERAWNLDNRLADNTRVMYTYMGCNRLRKKSNGQEMRTGIFKELWRKNDRLFSTRKQPLLFMMRLKTKLHKQFNYKQFNYKQFSYKILKMLLLTIRYKYQIKFVQTIDENCRKIGILLYYEMFIFSINSTKHKKVFPFLDNFQINFKCCYSVSM